MTIQIFLSLDGLEGESNDEHHENAIDVIAYAWQASIAAPVQGGRGASRRRGASTAEDLIITKPVDRASPGLLGAVFTGKAISEGTLTVRVSGDDEPRDVTVFEMQEIMVTDVSTGASAGAEQLIETVSLSFGEFTSRYVQYNSQGQESGAVEFGWDFGTNGQP